MAINVATLVPASLKSKNVATEQYVDTSIANIDVSSDISANNDVFAQKLGYASYQAMVNAAASGQTVVNGGYINTSLIKANAINANQINTSGLIAEDIITTTLTGKILNGSVINGAVINGAVVRASYLDLDGELEVLTNYHITPAMYNANPSLYTDAVYMSGTNEWRIPSISTVIESTVNYVTNSVSTYYGSISSYNTANARNNLKAVKIRPIWTNQTSFQIFNSVCSDTWLGGNMYYGRHNHFRLNLGSITLIECTVDLSSGSNPSRGEDDVTIVNIYGQNFSRINISVSSSQYPDYSNVYSIDIGIGVLSLYVSIKNSIKPTSDPMGCPNIIEIIGTLSTGTRETAFDWTNGRLQFDQIVAPSTTIAGAGNFYYTSIYGSTNFSLNQSLSINNMI